jgi:hypothetical protein
VISRARAVAVGMFLCSLAGVGLLHALRTDLSPVGNRLSEYANGPHGWLMAVVFGALGAGLIALGMAMRATTRPDRNPIISMVPATAFVAGTGAIVSGVFKTGVSVTSEVIHSRASALATLSIVALALVYSWPATRRRLGGAPDPVGFVLAASAAGMALLSPFLHDTRWTGLSQRVLWTLLLSWLLWTAWRLPRHLGAAAARGSSRGRGQ